MVPQIRLCQAAAAICYSRSRIKANNLIVVQNCPQFVSQTRLRLATIMIRHSKVRFEADGLVEVQNRTSLIP